MLKFASLIGYSLLLIGCAGSQPPPARVQEAKAQEAKVREAKVREAKVRKTKADTSGAEPATKTPAKSGPVASRLAASHILLAYKGAQRAKASVTRTRAEARALATQLATEFTKLDTKDAATPVKFSEAARKHSDCPSAAKGGNLGIWRPGQMTPAFDKATLALNYGEFSAAVETPFGFHVIRRVEVPIEYASSQILIAYEGAKRAVVKQRTRAQALELATTLAKQLQADPAQFERAAQVNSDDASGPRGGKLGILPKGMMPPAFDATLRKLKIGEVSDPVETPFGFHIILRDKP